MPTYKVVDNEVVARGKFPKRSIPALRESILKWKWLAKYIQSHPNQKVPLAHSSSCALCSIYIEGESQSCKGCPVYKKIRQSGCKGTPWVLYSDSSEMTSALIAAQAEVLFLESLLPKRSGR